MFTLETKQTLPISLEQAWEFFSDPENLAKITPGKMDFRIIRKPSGTMYPGMIISYRVKPLLGIPVTWVTEITQVQDKRYFVDEQRIGPYKMWHHQHHFREVDGGVEMTDIIDYAIPFGFLGRLANRLFIRRKLNHIFQYRSETVQFLFAQ